MWALGSASCDQGEDTQTQASQETRMAQSLLLTDC